MNPAAIQVRNAILSMPFPDYAERFLRIRTKTEGIKPFRLNAGQLYLHRKAEIQLQRQGYVRITLLKARQWGGCLAPDTPVLTADLRWRPIASLQEGDELVACDVAPLAAGTRKMRTATVEKVWRTKKPSYTITFDDGSSVVCSADHRWLSKKSQTQAEWRSINPRNRNGLSALKPGDWIRAVTDAWGEPTLDDAWFGGMIDGEGSFDPERKVGGVKLAVSQRAGPVLERLKHVCEARGYGEYTLTDNGVRDSKFGREPVSTIIIGAMRNVFRVMGLSRPTRFIGARWWEGRRLPNNGWRRIVAIEPGPEMELVDIQTSTGTYIAANGLVSHNSTYVQGRFYGRIARGGYGLRASILTHQNDATAAIFRMTHRFHNLLDRRIRPSAKMGRRHLEFPTLDSSYAVATAGTENVFRGETIQLFHGSEVAFWPNADEHLTGALQTVPPQGPGTEIFLESTGNGMGNPFQVNFAYARAGMSEFEPVFVPWFWFDEYRAPVRDLDLAPEDEEYAELWGLDEEQMQFRLNKIIEFGGGESGRAKFRQEYPATPEEAFSKNVEGGYIEAKYVLMARKVQSWTIKPVGPKILGIDPSFGGNDRFVCFLRQGRLAQRVGRWKGLRTTQSLPRVVNIIDQWKPDIVCIDAGGAGAALYDQLVDLCRRRRIVLVPVLGGEQADDPDLDRNVRSQNWRRMREWFESPLTPCIIDRVASYAEDAQDGLDEIQGDITSSLTDWDSKGRPVVETKKKLLTHAPSPDNGDALANTFTLQVGPDWTPPADHEEDDDRYRRPLNWRAV